MKMCLEILKVERKNRTEVHVYAHDQCQANLSMGWLVCACIAIFHEVITIFFVVLCRPNTFWSMYPGTVWCTQRLRNAILQKKKKKHCYQYKDFNHRCKDGYILGKTPVALPITTGYSLPPTWDRFRQKKGSRIWNDRAKLHDLALDPIHSWSTAADSGPPSDFSDRPPISISMTTGRKWLTWNRSIVPYFAEDRKDLEISKSSILKKKKRKWRTKIGPERTWTGDPWLKKLWSIHLSYNSTTRSGKRVLKYWRTPYKRSGRRPACTVFVFLRRKEAFSETSSPISSRIC